MGLISSNFFFVFCSKQCQSFRRTAEKVKQGLEEELDGVAVTINPDKVVFVFVLLFLLFLNQDLRIELCVVLVEALLVC